MNGHVYIYIYLLKCQEQVPLQKEEPQRALETIRTLQAGVHPHYSYITSIYTTVRIYMYTLTNKNTKSP
jgi:hypothetical protein